MIKEKKLNHASGKMRTNMEIFVTQLNFQVHV